MRVYLDYAATTPIDIEVFEAMLPYLKGNFANPSSLHTYGQKARNAVEDARAKVAKALGGSGQVIFTSGATEADNHAIYGAVSKYPKGHILTSQIEHAAVLSTCKHLETKGYEVTYLTPNEQGEITPEAVKSALRDDTILVALMLVNNETGIITDIADISLAVHKTNAWLFCDAAQAFSSIPVNIQELGVDILTISAHKAYGPKGVGVLYLREGLEIPPFLLGGEQERGFRAGTLNTLAIVGMGKTAELSRERQANDAKDIAALRDYLQESF